MTDPSTLTGAALDEAACRAQITKTETLEIRWHKPEFSTWRQRSGDARRLSHSDLKCFVCRRPFKAGDVVGLTCFEEYGNRVVCAPCSDDIEAAARAVAEGAT